MKRCEDCLHLKVCQGLYFNLDTKCDRKCGYFKKCSDYTQVVRCEDCKHWHKQTGWCIHHSHFINSDGEACHPSESMQWKMLQPDDFCSYGNRKENN